MSALTANDAPAVSAALSSAERQRVASQLLGTMGTIRRTIRRHGGRPAELSTLTGAQLELVRLVRRRPAVSITDAARELLLAPNTVSTLVRQLTDDGLVLRQIDESDRRVARLKLAADMRRKVDAWRDRRVVTLDAAIGQLPRGDQRRLLEALPVLERLAEQLEALRAER